MNFSSVIIKSTLLSTCIFWLVIMSENFETDIIPFIFISIIPITLCCSLTILFTITPFFWLKNKKKSNTDVHKRYFPFYTLSCFGLCISIIIGSRFDIFIISFFSAAFFTSLQAWIWFVKDNSKTDLESKNALK